MITLTLVVSIYNVENYISRFLDTLEKNLQKGVEVLLINDGTEDQSGNIAEKFASKYPEYVKVVHKNNGGVSSARNKGLELATGQYIIFPDPDDFLADDYVETILKAIDSYGCPDMIFFDYYIGNSDVGFKVNTIPHFKEGVIDKEKFIKEHIKDDFIKGYVWCKAVKKSLYHKLSFNTNTRCAEDYEILTDLVLRLEKIVYIKKPLYFYIQRANSLTHNKNIEDELRFYDLIADRQKKHSYYYKYLSGHKLVKASHGLIMRKYLFNECYDIKKYELTIKENIFSILFSSEFSLNEKKQCLLVCLGIAEFYYRKKYRNIGRK